MVGDNHGGGAALEHFLVISGIAAGTSGEIILDVIFFETVLYY
jgi:hypothetical protein